MTRILPTLLGILFLYSCTSVKNTQKSLNKGQYDLTIQKSLDKLSRNKDKKKSIEYAQLLQEAFKKASNEDLNHISFLEKDANPIHLEEIYHSYLKLKDRQDKIRPILPLSFGNKTIDFNFVNHDANIIASKAKLSEYLYINAKTAYHNARSKEAYRSVYDQLKYLEQYTPNYKNLNELLDNSYKKGRIYCLVSLRNNTNMVIPRPLENDILNIDMFNNDSFWTSFHCEKDEQTTYDYDIRLDFLNIRVSPEHVKQEHHTYEKQITKEEYLLDNDGKRVKNDKGEEIILVTKENVVCRFHRLTQLKTTDLAARVLVYDLVQQNTVDSFPLQSSILFDHVYATREGDIRALEDNLLPLLRSRAIPFPTTEQMIYDSSLDLKEQFKRSIRNKLP